MLDFLSSPSPLLPGVGPGARDTLTALLLGLRLDGVEYGRSQLSRPWAIALPAQRHARFHFMAQGSAWLQGPDGQWQALHSGDAVLLPRGSAHVLASDPTLAPVEESRLTRIPVAEQLYLQRCPGQASPEGEPAPQGDLLFSGALRFNLDPLHPLLAMMPPLLHAGELARRDPSVPALLEAMEREVALDHIGACGILARLADALAASIIRAWVEGGCPSDSGWVAALRCPKIGRVIAAIHAQPQHDWSVPELAALIGVSRSRFAEAFSRTMGESPARYVAKIKMFQARQWISQEGLRIAQVAERLGYDSEASFSRAFKRIIGHPPSAERPALYAAPRAAGAQPAR